MKRFLLALSTSAMLLSAAPVFAQGEPGKTGPEATTTGVPMRARGEHRMQERLHAFHDRLGITPAQQPQWDAMVATMRDNRQAMRADPAAVAIRSGQVHGIPAVRAAASLAQQRADGMQRMIPAVEGLYNVLSPEQRQVADQAIDRMLRHGPRRG